jgi:phosphate transport system substrate-binding protein
MRVRSSTTRGAALGLKVAATLLAAALVSPLTAAPAQAASLVPIAGTGSTWAQGAFDSWRVAVASRSGQTVSYAGSGSRAGLTDLAEGTVSFAVSEQPYGSPADGADAIPAPSIAFDSLPIVAGATSIAYNLRSGGAPIVGLRLSGETVAKIFTGLITVWNDPAIQRDNPQIALPDQTITPVVRADVSGSTAVFTRWLATQHKQIWGDYCLRRGAPANCGEASLYPIVGGMKSQAGSLGVAGYVGQDYGLGSITYVEDLYAVKSGLTTVRLGNAAGSFVAPTAGAVAIALGNTGAAPEGAFANQDPRAYALSSYSSMLVPNEASATFTAEQGRSLGEFARYALCEGQALVEAKGYAPLPPNLVSEGLGKIHNIPGADSVDVARDGCGAEAPNSIGLAVVTIPAADSALSIEFPAAEPAEFAEAGLVDGLSVVTGALPAIRVYDGRVTSDQGWDLAANLTPFVNTADGGQVIGTRNVGLRAIVISTTAAGAVAALPQHAGHAVYPASFASGSGAGETVLGGEVTLVSPADSPAGTYTATLTLTITSR